MFSLTATVFQSRPEWLCVLLPGCETAGTDCEPGRVFLTKGNKGALWPSHEQSAADCAFPDKRKYMLYCDLITQGYKKIGMKKEQDKRREVKFSGCLDYCVSKKGGGSERIWLTKSAHWSANTTGKLAREGFGAGVSVRRCPHEPSLVNKARDT